MAGCTVTYKCSGCKKQLITRIRLEDDAGKTCPDCGKYVSYDFIEKLTHPRIKENQ